MISLLCLSAILLVAYGLNSTRVAYPLLQLNLFRFRTFQASVVGGFITRLGIAGIPFLFPLLFQVGLGFSPVESGLFLMPQALAAMMLKSSSSSILARFGYRNILVSNTAILGIIIIIFASIGLTTPWWVIALELFGFGFFASLQYTSMNSLVYADVTPLETSRASTIASAMQQMSISFGVAVASLTTAFFVMDPHNASPAEMITGIHKAFFFLGGLTILSSLIFYQVRPGDGSAISQHK
jgi:hypothetical protein